MVIDADTIAEANLLSAIRSHFAAGAKAVQTRYTALAPAAKWLRIALSRLASAMVSASITT